MSETSNGAMAPVALSERIDVIDILRGMTLFGILMANMRGFSTPSQLYYSTSRLFPGTADRIAQRFLEFFVHGKGATLFAVLFGVGFAVQMMRAEERGKPVSFYPRRLAILFVIGMIHSIFIWWGDILVPYAVTGFLLLLFRKQTQRTVAWCAALLFSTDLLLAIGWAVWGHFHPSPPIPASPARPWGLSPGTLHAISVYRDGSFWGMVQYRLPDWFGMNWPPWWLVTFVLPRFLAGLWLWRTGVLQDLKSHLPFIRKVYFWALAIGSACTAAMAYFWFVAPPPRGVFTLAGFVDQFLHAISLPAIACFYACAVVLLVQQEDWNRRLTPFGAVGRMALTNYLLQSLIGTWFFHWTKLYMKVGPAMGLILTVVLFALQVAASVWWLRRFRFGPVEWAWRSLTYGKWQPFVVRDAGQLDQHLLHDVPSNVG